jgi:dienelactone hydrolase
MDATRAITFALVFVSGLYPPTASSASTTTSVEYATVGQALYPGASVPSSVPGTLRIPDGDGPFAAMVILHGSAGIDGRGEQMAKVLLDAGIASIEPDMWKSRGLGGGTKSRPRIISDTLPDAYGALVYLAAHPRIDPKRIGILGFSWGGAVSWITAFGLKPLNTGSTLDALHFAAHVPFYASCTGYLPTARGGKALASIGVKPTGAPMLFIMGTKDDYESDPNSCQTLQRSYPETRMRLRMVEGATHGFDGNVAGRAYDDLAKDGKGGWITITPDPVAAAAVRKEVADFLVDVLRPGAR